MNGSLHKKLSCNSVRSVISKSSSAFQIPSNDSIFECAIIVLLTICIILINVLMIAVLHSRNHHRYLKKQPRYLMTSLAVSDLAIGSLVTPFSIYPSLYHCWPFGSIACAVESLLISALFHQSSLSLMCIAVDRYICIIHPLRYQAMITTKVCMSMIIISWMTSFTVYSSLIYPHSQYVFDPVGIQTCEPYYANMHITILVVCLFYLPPFVIITYCYLAIFFVAKKQFEKAKCFAITASSCSECSTRPYKVISKERLKNYQTALSLAFMALGYGVAVTPWNLTMLICSCMEITVTKHTLFAVTWIAVSNCFWNPIVYGVMNRSFRNVAIEVLKRVFCIER